MIAACNFFFFSKWKFKFVFGGLTSIKTGFVVKKLYFQSNAFFKKHESICKQTFSKDDGRCTVKNTSHLKKYLYPLEINYC